MIITGTISEIELAYETVGGFVVIKHSLAFIAQSSVYLTVFAWLIQKLEIDLRKDFLILAVLSPFVLGLLLAFNFLDDLRLSLKMESIICKIEETEKMKPRELCLVLKKSTYYPGLVKD